MHAHTHARALLVLLTGSYLQVCGRILLGGIGGIRWGGIGGIRWWGIGGIRLQDRAGLGARCGPSRTPGGGTALQ